MTVSPSLCHEHIEAIKHTAKQILKGDFNVTLKDVLTVFVQRYKQNLVTQGCASTSALEIAKHTANSIQEDTLAKIQN